MRTFSNAVTVMVAGLLIGSALTGCTGGGPEAERSADQMLDEAYETMNDLKSVTILSSVRTAGSGVRSGRLTTDLVGTCTNKVSWSEGGGTLEQIRIGATDYVRPDRAYLKKWSGRDTSANGEQKRWVKAPISDAKPEDGLVDCTWSFSAFGTPVKGKPAEVGGRRAMRLVVTEAKATYTFYVATEGKPYLLQVVYKGDDFRSTTTFGAFDEPLGIEAPPAKDTLDTADIG
ncbi:hypothetical protein AB0M10_02165 [Streptomyces sp. NPDC051840]|uniref:hypothetical protein n=1 Tax=unclassified Streptomyces TaxID=2593676 RepID=UPI00343B4FE8